jgi:hypothetical protein
MRIAGPIDLNARTGLKTWAALPLRCEKPSGSSDLGQERPEFNADDREAPAALRVELVCQDETPRFDPLWDGPRLLPTFAAQLIGQAMLDRRDPAACVETAYGRIGAPRMALLMDRKS